MKIQINEVWNSIGKSEKLVVIETPSRSTAMQDVWDWVGKHRPDLDLACGIYSHGFHAKEVA